MHRKRPLQLRQDLRFKLSLPPFGTGADFLSGAAGDVDSEARILGLTLFWCGPVDEEVCIPSANEEAAAEAMVHLQHAPARVAAGLLLLGDAAALALDAAPPATPGRPRGTPRTGSLPLRGRLASPASAWREPQTGPQPGPSCSTPPPGHVRFASQSSKCMQIAGLRFNLASFFCAWPWYWNVVCVESTLEWGRGRGRSEFWCGVVMSTSKRTF